MATKTNLPNREELLQMAENAAKGGQTEGARMMFRQVLDQDKRNERAMMWMAKLARSQKERKQWLTRVLSVNPNNETARSALAKMQHVHAARENRTLLIFGVVAAVLIVVLVVIVIAIAAS